MTEQFTFLDLFCGCGGFTLGMNRAGFQSVGAIDVDPLATLVFKENFPSVPNVVTDDLTSFTPDKFAQLSSINEVDVIVGGPPCQGFSTVRQRDGANNGPRMIDDKRRHLYQEFLRYVQFFRPKVFVMENVLGIKSAAGGYYFTRVQQEARSIGYRVHPQVERAVDLGVPQKRARQLIIGTRLDLPEYFQGNLLPSLRAVNSPTLWQAIGDLPPVQAGGGVEEAEYDMERRKKHRARHGHNFLYKTLEVQLADKLTAHRARPHSKRDLRDFQKLMEGENCAQAIKRGQRFEFPYDKKTFKDRYTRQHRNKPCSTIVAHLSKDGLMFIHPTQNRSLTPREAARVQSFPDWFVFSVARTHQFRLIGNAVPPLVAESVGFAVKSYIGNTMRSKQRISAHANLLPKYQREAIEWLLDLVHAADKKILQEVPSTKFKRGWFSIGFLYPGLHPNAALEHGKSVSQKIDDWPEARKVEPRLLAPYYVQSGWPVVLEPVAKEAWRRYEDGEMKENEFYCSDAAASGLRWLQPQLSLGRLNSQSSTPNSNVGSL